MNLLENIYASGKVSDDHGKTYRLDSHIDAREGQFLFDYIRERCSIRKTVEIGCAYGISSLHICGATKGRDGAHHTIIDPFQMTQWHGIGIANLRREGIDFFELIEEGSEFALPTLAREKPGTYDLAFIDGWHTFDHTIIDLFYANLLVRVGGHIIIDDCNWASVAKAVNYVSRYPAFRLSAQSSSNRSLKRAGANLISRLPGSLLPRGFYDHIYGRTLFSTMVALEKIASDDRRWDWFVSF